MAKSLLDLVYILFHAEMKHIKTWPYIFREIQFSADALRLARANLHSKRAIVQSKVLIAAGKNGNSYIPGAKFSLKTTLNQKFLERSAKSEREYLPVTVQFLHFSLPIITFCYLAKGL